MSVQRSVAGDGKCPCCGRVGQFKLNKSSRIYFKCVSAADGGCLLDCQPRHEKSEKWLAKGITRWRDPETQDRLGFGKAKKDQAPAPAELEDDADPQDDDAPAAPEKKTPWYDKEII